MIIDPIWYTPALSQLTRQCVWLSVTGLVEEISVPGLSCAGSVLESAASELLQSAAQREWPVLIQQQGRPSAGLHIYSLSLICGHLTLHFILMQNQRQELFS